eukprot:m.213601 g.213601  ORF g.213601 m.213601 type:complete len:95 (+) comp39793_c0_seq12:51-335(+)
MKTSMYKLYTNDRGDQWFANDLGDQPAKEWADKVRLWFGCPTGRIPILSDALIRCVARVSEGKWEDIAVELGFQTSYTDEIKQYQSSNFVRLGD